jgi:hypothetical protein
MKKIIQQIFKNQSGVIAVLISVIIMAAILTVTLAASAIIQNGIIMGKTQVHSTKSYFAAEAGLERLLYEIRNDASPFNTSTCSVNDYANLAADQCQAGLSTITLSNSTTFNIQYRNPSLSTCPPSGVCSVSFYSYGSFQGVQRAVEVAY